MIITLRRELDDGVGIRGSLYDASGLFLGYTMEPSVRRAEHPGILPGLYALAWTPSPRLKRSTLELIAVPAVLKPRKPCWKFPGDWRQGIRIHPLNQPHESLGCIGIGLGRDKGNFIASSRKAVAAVENRIREYMASGIPVWLQVGP